MKEIVGCWSAEWTIFFALALFCCILYNNGASYPLRERSRSVLKSSYVKYKNGSFIRVLSPEKLSELRLVGIILINSPRFIETREDLQVGYGTEYTCQNDRSSRLHQQISLWFARYTRSVTHGATH